MTTDGYRFQCCVGVRFVEGLYASDVCVVREVCQPACSLSSCADIAGRQVIVGFVSFVYKCSPDI